LLGAHGAHVICTSRKIESCELVAQAIRKDGGSAEAHALHIGDATAIEAFFAQLDADGRARLCAQAEQGYENTCRQGAALFPA